MSGEYTIALIPGDGIGTEIMPEGVKALQAAAEVDGGFQLRFDPFPWGTEYYLENGRMMPPDGLKILEAYDAIYLGAVGFPSLAPDHITLWGLLLPIRKSFEQYINLRPIQLLPGMKGPLRDKRPEDIDFVCVRENTEGEYAGVGGRVNVGKPQEVALQTSVFTRQAIERTMRYSFELAQSRPQKKLTSATKSNACQYSMVLWDEIFAELATDYPDITTEQWHIDALAARLVSHPETLDVIVASNLHGDILTDLGGALLGSLGIPPSANINPERRWPSMFESVHGSAPDIAGKSIANPIAAIWSGAMMLEFLGENKAAETTMAGIIEALKNEDAFTPDLGGSARTSEMGDEICKGIFHLG